VLKNENLCGKIDSYSKKNINSISVKRLFLSKENEVIYFFISVKEDEKGSPRMKIKTCFNFCENLKFHPRYVNNKFISIGK
jgi:hypothetical protein